jgi:ferredoxin like protein
MNLADKLFRLRYKVDPNNPHIKVDAALCKQCENKVCLRVCPAEVFTIEGDEIAVGYQGCLECGTCRVSCPLGAIEWRYPRGGFGVYFRFG